MMRKVHSRLMMV